MNMLALIAITWIGKEYRFLGLDWSYLMVLGFIGNALFSMRFLVQWLASERQGESVIPVSFWYWSIAGSVLMCVYFVFRRDPIGILAYLPNSNPRFLRAEIHFRRDGGRTSILQAQ